jgi:hypothetical protein
LAETSQRISNVGFSLKGRHALVVMTGKPIACGNRLAAFPGPLKRLQQKKAARWAAFSLRVAGV